jgi:hypothetical protein
LRGSDLGIRFDLLRGCTLRTEADAETDKDKENCVNHSLQDKPDWPHTSTPLSHDFLIMISDHDFSDTNLQLATSKQAGPFRAACLFTKTSG